MTEQIFWDSVLFGNPIHDYAITLGIFVVWLIFLRYAQHFIFKHLRTITGKTETDFDNKLVAAIESLRPPFYFFLSVYFSSKTLILAPTAEKVLSSILVLWVVYQIIVVIETIVDYAISKKLKEGGQDDSSQAVTGVFRIVMRFSVWSIGLILALSNLNVNVTSLVAGLGIGGIAIALATQNILGDLFSSFAIHLDKPFAVGDFIIIGNDLGTVKKIGLRTTRIATLRGEELIVENKELTSTRIMNFKQMKERRVVSVIKVDNTIDREKLKAIPGWYKIIIEKETDARFDRSHFSNFGESWLEFETVYYVLSPEYNLYMDIQQKINISILEKLDEEGVSLAVPTRKMYTIKG